MKATKHFASFLYFAVLFGLIVSVLYFVLALSAIFFGNNGQYIIKSGNSTFIIGNKSSEGYTVPVTLTLQIPDSININKDHFGITTTNTYPHINNDFLKENQQVKALNIYKAINMNDHENITKDENGNYLNPKPSKFQFIKYVQGGNSQCLKIKTTDNFTNLILALREQLQFIFFILKLFFLSLLLKELAKEIYFSQKLSTCISRLGYVFLFSQLIPIIYTFVDTKLFGVIIVEPQILASLQNTYFQNIKVSFNPVINVELYVILLGSILVLLAKLAQRGRTLEIENELTI